MSDSERASKILKRLREEYPKAEGTSLEYETPMQLLVATILSAQSTDERTNQITSELFEEHESPADFAGMGRKELEEAIYSSGFYHNKAKWIQETAKKIVEDFDCEIPDDMESLTELTGVGRKTANIVLSEAFGKIEGVPVDTHVKRLSGRLGLSQEKNRGRIEEDLMELLPRERWYEFSTLLISHGRSICTARNPDCDKCIIDDLCPSAGTFE